MDPVFDVFFDFLGGFLLFLCVLRFLFLFFIAFLFVAHVDFPHIEVNRNSIACWIILTSYLEVVCAVTYIRT